MKKRIIAFLLAIPFLLVGCTNESESVISEASTNTLTAKSHFSKLTDIFDSHGKYAFFDSIRNCEIYDFDLNTSTDEISGRIEADFFDNRYKLDCNIHCSSDESEYESLALSAIYGDGNAYVSVKDIEEAPLKLENTESYDYKALRSLYGVRLFVNELFVKDAEKYYNIANSDDGKSTIATLALNNDDVRAYAERTKVDEEYGFDANSIELDFNATFKTSKADNEIGLSLDEFLITSTLSYKTDEQQCVLELNYSENSFNACFTVYANGEKNEVISKYTVKSENGSGSVILNGKARRMDTNGYANAPDEFLCHTVELPFEFTESKNGWQTLTIERIRFKGISPELDSNTATTADGGEFVFGKDVNISVRFFDNDAVGFDMNIRIDDMHLKIAESRTGSYNLDIHLPESYTEDEVTFINKLYEKAPIFCEHFNVLPESELYETNIEVADGYGTYVIDEAQRNGFFLSTFTMETEEIVLADGRRIPLNYSEFAYDEETKTHQAVINSRNYRLSEYTDYEGVLCQSLECIDEIDGYAITASVLYYPELEYGNITMGFVIEKNENGEYKFTYPDGHSETRKVLFDEELGMYYFE